MVRNIRQLGSSPASWTFAALVLVIQLFVSLVGGPNHQPAWTWYETLGLSRGGSLSGNVWQVMTYGLIHGYWWHAGLNAAFILLIGSRIENMIGWKVVAMATLAGVIGGGIAHLFIATGLLVGISGGCMALLLLMITLSPESRMLPLPISARSLGLGLMTAALILAMIDPALAIPGFSMIGTKLVDHRLGIGFKMGHACHFGGGLAGWLLGMWILRPRITLERLRRDRERREANESQR